MSLSLTRKDVHNNHLDDKLSVHRGPMDFNTKRLADIGKKDVSWCYKTTQRRHSNVTLNSG